jgi:hypothetical protein
MVTLRQTKQSHGGRSTKSRGVEKRATFPTAQAGTWSRPCLSVCHKACSVPADVQHGVAETNSGGDAFTYCTSG